MDSAQILQFTFSGLTLGSVYALMAVSLSIVYKVSKVISFAQGEFYVIGALGMVAFRGMGLPMPVAFICALLVAALLGAAIQRVLIRPALKSPLGVVVTMTIAISLALRGLALLVWGRGSHTSPAFTSGDSLAVLGAALQLQVLWIIGVTFAILIIIWLFFEKSMLGIAMRACADDPLGASLVGVSTKKMSLVSWAWGSALGALAGIVVAPLYFVQYASGVMPMVAGFVAIAISGFASVLLAVLAGFFLGFIEAYGIGFVSSQFSDVITFTVLICVLLLRTKFGSDRSFEEGGM